ncbi:MAG: hypothetical protein QM493_03825 [Sulfurovum sp.]
MDKSFMVFMAIGVGGLYYVTSAVQNIQEGDPSVQSEEYKQKHKFDEYQTVDSIGQDILDVTDITLSEQIEAWNSSILKEDFLALFPDFEEMKLFIEERVRGDEVKTHINSAIEKIESDFFSGKINAESAQRKLGKIK